MVNVDKDGTKTQMAFKKSTILKSILHTYSYTDIVIDDIESDINFMCAKRHIKVKVNIQLGKTRESIIHEDM